MRVDIERLDPADEKSVQGCYQVQVTARPGRPACRAGRLAAPPKGAYAA
jgi:hypothetical protein